MVYIASIHGAVRFAPGSLADARSGDFLELWSKNILYGMPYELPNSLKVKHGQPLSP